MTRAATQAEINDHRYDLRKHDADPLPLRMSPPIATALEVAVMVKGLKNIRDAEALVEQYAKTCASEAVLQATIETTDRMMAVINGHSKEPV